MDTVCTCLLNINVHSFFSFGSLKHCYCSIASNTVTHTVIHTPILATPIRLHLQTFMLVVSLHVQLACCAFEIVDENDTILLFCRV